METAPIRQMGHANYTCGIMRLPMARGWESKAVEELRDETPSAPDNKKAVRTPEQQERARKRGELQLARKRVQGDLTTATNPRHRDLLERTLADLDKRLQDLEGKG